MRPMTFLLQWKVSLVVYQPCLPRHCSMPERHFAPPWSDPELTNRLRDSPHALTRPPWPRAWPCLSFRRCPETPRPDRACLRRASADSAMAQLSCRFRPTRPAAPHTARAGYPCTTPKHQLSCQRHARYHGSAPWRTFRCAADPGRWSSVPHRRSRDRHRPELSSFRPRIRNISINARSGNARLRAQSPLNSHVILTSVLASNRE